MSHVKLSVLLLFASLPSWASPNCPIGSHWVAAHFRRAYVRGDGKRFSATTVSAHCRTNPKGYDVWHSRLSNQRPRVWGYKYEKSKKWTTEEIERVLEALSELPEFLLNQEADSLYRMSGSEEPGNPATTNFKDTVLYDKAFAPDQNLARVIAHEQAHRLFDSLTEVERTGFKTAGEWVKVREGSREFEKPGRPASAFVQLDGQRSPSEDFANSVESFVFEKEKLKAVSPRVYDWINSKWGSKDIGRDQK